MAAGQKKKKWSKGKVKDKANRLVIFDKETYDKLYKEVPVMRVITQSSLVEKLNVTASLAKKALIALEKEGHIKLIAKSNAQVIYTRATVKAEE